MQASIGLAQINKLDEFIKIRKFNYMLLRNLLKDFKNYFILPSASFKSNPSWFGFPFSLNGNETAIDMMKFLNSKGVQTRPILSGNIAQQPVAKTFKYKSGNLKNSIF